AFPIGIGTALVIGTFLNLLVGRPGSPLILLIGVLVIMVAILMDALGYSSLTIERHEALAKAGKAKSTRRPSGMKGILLSIVSGLLMGAFAPLVRSASLSEIGLGPYSVGAIFAIGVFFSTFAYSLFFVNLPVEGDPVDIGDYLGAPAKRHLLGFMGGAIFIAGFVAVQVAGAATEGARLAPTLTFQIYQAFAIVAALIGLFIWGEQTAASGKVKAMTLAGLLLYIAGVVVLSMGQVYVRPTYDFRYRDFQDTAGLIASLTELMFLTPSRWSHSSRAFTP